MAPTGTRTAVKVQVVIERKQAETPAFVVLPASRVAPWKLSATTTVEGTLDGVALGRRSLKELGDGRWFIELHSGLLEAVGRSPGERAELVIRIASVELPAELQQLIDSDPAARARWEARTAAQQRMLREEILSAKGSSTRERRARRALLPPARPRAARIDGLRPAPQAILVRILARRLPGRACGPYTEIAVGLAGKVGCDPTAMIGADARQAKWETTIQIRERDGQPAFNGPAVNGPPRERFLYLTWIGRRGGAAPAMFRRAKLRLDAVPAEVLARSLRSGLLVGRLDLTAPDGMPLCASVRPPAITWESS